MIARSLAKLVCAALVGVGMPLSIPAQQASAAPCPDIEVVFARGTAEPPGLGLTGSSFAEAMRLRSGGKSVGTYAVNYAASAEFNAPLNVARTALDGIRDVQAHSSTWRRIVPPRESCSADIRKVP